MRTFLALFLACTPPPVVVDDVAWSKERAPLAASAGPVRGFVPMRAIVHLHSPYSHDACDGDGWVDGVFDEDCLGDLRSGLCDAGIDVAFLTDHPNFASMQPFEDLLLARPGDVPVVVDGAVVGSRVACDDGHAVTLLPGIEDRLMPVALQRHVHPEPSERHRLYNSAGEEAVRAALDAGGAMFVPHTESRSDAHLMALQAQGLTGIEVFNLHAMFAPNIRPEYLGLDPWSWLADASPFIDPDGSAEPDLLFLAVLAEQAPSVAKWDRLLEHGPMVGVGGSDAHQNTIPMALRDGERGDSYRRVLSWFSNVLLVDGDDPLAPVAALRAGRSYVAFEALGVPRGFDVRLVRDGLTHEMGSDAPVGALVVSCPTLAAGSPRGPDAPEITVTVYRDGVPWAQGCGVHDAAAPGVYRVRVDLTPHHLRPFLGDDPEPWMRPFPWLYSNAIRVGL